MDDLYKVKEMLVNELKEFGRKGDLTKPSLDAINKLAHAAKNVCKVIDYCEQEKYDYKTTINSVSNSGNTYTRPYAMSTDDVRSHLYRLMENAKDEGVREELRRMINTF